MSEIIPYQPRVVALPTATSAESDEQLLASWLASLNSPHSRRNFEQSVRRFLSALPNGLRHATVEQVRGALDFVTAGLSPGSARQYVLRAKSLMTYAYELGYSPFNAGVTIKVRAEGERGAALAKRIITETEVALLIRAARTRRDNVLIQVAYAAGIRVSEIVGLDWSDVIPRDGMVQLNILGKGSKVRQVLLPENVSNALLSLGMGTGPVFVSREGGRLTERSVHAMVKRLARKAGVTPSLSPHWLRHAHASHALDNDATLAEVQATLGHANVSTTSGYLHARPDSSSGLKLDPGIFGK
jgi:site-specific recombinase XerD